MRPHGSPEELERRRQRAISLLNQGYPPVEVARMVGVDRRSVRRWKAAYRTAGLAAIRARSAPGRPPKLDAKARATLQRILLKGAQAAGFPTDLWTCPRIVHVIRSRFRVTYQVSGVWRVLRALGWSPKKPERRAIERNEAAIRRWVRQDWPRIKKKRPG